MTCHCRFCGTSICYSRDEAGHDAQCPRCSQLIRLPGKLASIATVERGRAKDRIGLALEISGFVAMFFFFPWGLAAGIILVVLGWRRSNLLSCSSCGARVASRDLLNCPKCRVPFGRE